MGDFRKNISHRLISKENNSRKEIPGGKIPILKKKNLWWRIILEKNLTPVNVKNKKQEQNSYPNQITPTNSVGRKMTPFPETVSD